MGRAFLCLLFLSAAVSAQPWGPVEIASTSDPTQRLQTPQIAVIDSQTARVVFDFDNLRESQIRTVLFDLATHQAFGTPEIARIDTVPMALLDLAVDGEGPWIAVFNRRYPGIQVIPCMHQITPNSFILNQLTEISNQLAKLIAGLVSFKIPDPVLSQYIKGLAFNRLER